MIIETSRFGSIEVKDDSIIEFPWGIPGFESVKRYVLLEHGEGPFQWLQAVDEPSLAFVVCLPEVIGISYEVPTACMEPIGAKAREDLIVLTLISFDRDKNIIRFHLRSPLIFNIHEKKGYQWTMDKEEVKACVKLPEGMEWEEVEN
ncbi:MAG: flagellar assembly protein FliW [Thermodesulforhabdaceae bacterium]|jgi:flagellar assembly factor FliW